MEKPAVSVSLVNWNGGTDIIRCLESVYAQTYPNIREVVIVDNGSTDGSVALIEEKFPNVRILKNDSNLGFCKAHNQAIRMTQGEFVLLLNFDILLEPDFLSYMVSAMTSEDRIGMVSGKLYRIVNGAKTKKLDSTGIIMRQYFPAPRGDGEEDTGQYDVDACRYILGPCGAAPLYRRAMLEDTKCQGEYFDEEFVNYVEDVDLAWRAKLLGWIAVYEPSAVACHERGATRKTNQREQSNYFLKGFRNRYLSMYKNITKEQWRKNRFKIINRELLFLFGPSCNTNTVSIRFKALREAQRLKNLLRNKRKYIQSRIKISPRELESFSAYEQFNIFQFLWARLKNKAFHFIHKTCYFIHKVKIVPMQILIWVYRRLKKRFFPL